MPPLGVDIRIFINARRQTRGVCGRAAHAAAARPAAIVLGAGLLRGKTTQIRGN